MAMTEAVHGMRLAGRRNEPVAFRLYGVGCHVCGRPATAWTSGVTLPCGCGADRTPIARSEGAGWHRA
jgi:hypothetical protein